MCCGRDLDGKFRGLFVDRDFRNSEENTDIYFLFYGFKDGFEVIYKFWFLGNNFFIKNLYVGVD